MKIKLVPKFRGRLYECFECGTEYVVPMKLDECMNCGESDNFHRMS